MNTIKIHILHTGDVRVSPYLPFGGDKCSILKASGITTPKSKWIWLPVCCYYIETQKGNFSSIQAGIGTCRPMASMTSGLRYARSARDCSTMLTRVCCQREMLWMSNLQRWACGLPTLTMSC